VLLHYLAKWGNTKIAFLTRCISALPEFNQSLLDFFNLFDSRLTLTLLYDSLNISMNAFNSEMFGDVVGRGSGERKSRALQQLDCVARTKHHGALSSGFSLSQGNAEAPDR